jgi:diguanylate cyclase (GGDEF)-like protein
MEPSLKSSSEVNLKRSNRWRAEATRSAKPFPKAVEPLSSDIQGESHSELKNQKLSTSSIVSPELNKKHAETPSSSVVSQFNALRTKQLIIICFMTSAVALINNLINQQSAITSQVLLTSFVLFGACYGLVQTGRVKVAGQLLLWSLFGLISVLMISNDGLRDPVNFGYAGILIFAAMLGRKLDFLLLVGCITSTILIVGLANHKGIISYSNNSFGWGVTIDLLIIFAVVSYAVWILATDLRYALSSLEVENLRVHQSKIAYQRIAQYDHLTGLPNRVVADDRFKQAISHAARDHSMVAVLFIDLDNFKTVNDSLGHEVGDKLLQKVAKRLLESVRDCDTVCRLGGDEFLVIVDGIRKHNDVSRVSDYILTNVSRKINIDGHHLMATCSIGVSLSPVDGVDFDELRKKADMAMYKAKKAGRNGQVFFDQAMNKDMLAHIDRISSLRNAIINKQLELHYQPKVDLKSGRVFSAEALIRWRKEDGTLVYPIDFIAIAEKTGLIIEIGDWVLYEACRQCKEFQNKGLQDFSIAVNLSSIQFRRGNLVQVVEAALAAAGLDPSYLELEVTETLLVEDSKEVKAQIKQLQRKGITFSIDDFGTGYSSLAYLKDFNFDYLKIDRSFVEKCVEQKNDMILCQAIISMAHKLKLMVVAEGLETNSQRAALASAGCEFGQGNYFSKAVPVEEFYQFCQLENKRQMRVHEIEDYIGSFV